MLKYLKFYFHSGIHLFDDIAQFFFQDCESLIPCTVSGNDFFNSSISNFDNREKSLIL